MFDYGLVFTVDEDDVRWRLEMSLHFILYGWSVFPEGSVLCSHTDKINCTKVNKYHMLANSFCALSL